MTATAYEIRTSEELGRLGKLEVGTIFYYFPERVGGEGRFYKAGIVIPNMPEFLVRAINWEVTCKRDAAKFIYEDCLGLQTNAEYNRTMKDWKESHKYASACEIQGCKDKLAVLADIPVGRDKEVGASIFMKHLCRVINHQVKGEVPLYPKRKTGGARRR